jgi:hypothetical protein
MMDAGTSATGRLFLPALLAALFLAMVAAHAVGLQDAANRLLFVAGIHWGQTPFFDVYNPMSWLDCARAGLDITVVNPCDEVFGTTLVYSPAFMWLTPTGLGRPDTVAVGLAMNLAFIASLVLLPGGRGLGDAAAMAALMFSNTVLFAMYQANIDLLLFTLVVTACAVLPGRVPARALGYGLIMVAFLLKLYPIAAFAVVARERLATMLAIAAGVMVAAGLFALTHIEALRAVSRAIPAGNPLHMFGLASTRHGLSSMLPQLALPGAAIAAILAVLLLLAALVAWRVAASRPIGAALDRLPEHHRLLLLAGGAVLVFCFLSGESYRYRGVFLLAVMPALLALRHDLSGGARIAIMALAGLVVALAWGVYVSLAIDHLLKGGVLSQAPVAASRSLAWALRDLGWWIAMGALGGLAARTAWAMRGPREAWNWLSRRRAAAR